MLIDKIENLVSKLKSAEQITGDLVPIEIISALDPNEDDNVVGSLLLSLRRKKYNFNGTYEDVSTYQEAFEKVKTSSTKEEEFYYTLIFLSLFNRITDSKVKKLLKIILD